MSAGTGPYGHTPAGYAASTPTEETRSSLSSSRLINGVTKRYVVNDEGGFEAMDDIAQTVLLRISFAVREAKFITPQGMADDRTAIRNALADMTKGAEPLIKIKTIEVTDSGKATTYKRVVYQNLMTNTLQTVEPT